jgi:hypothetical protein
VEVKSWISQDQRSKIPGTRSVVNKLLQAEGQAATVILEGRGSGLTSGAAQAGMAMYVDLPHRGNVTAVRVLGDGFDLAWTRVRALEGHCPLTGRDGPGRPRSRHSPDAGLAR